jgi:hypothetical protein
MNNNIENHVTANRSVPLPGEPMQLNPGIEMQRRSYNSVNHQTMTDVPTSWAVRLLGAVPRLGVGTFHLLALMLFCFPWLDVSCARNRHQTIFQDADRVTQSGLQMCFGGATKYARGSQIKVADDSLACPLMIVYAAVLGLGMAAVFIGRHRLRAGISMALALAAILAIVIQTCIGFPLLKAAGSSALIDVNAGITLVFLGVLIINAAAFLMTGVDMILAVVVFGRSTKPKPRYRRPVESESWNSSIR